MSTRSEFTVIGGGTMGRGIAVAALIKTAAAVTVVETDAERAEALIGDIADDVRSREGGDVSSRLRVVSSVEEAPESDLIVEAIPEIPDLKKRVLAAAEQRLNASGILASNTSSLSVTSLAEALTQPERFLGMHFFQPVPDTVLTELILHEGVADETVDAAQRWTQQLGRTPISATDTAGFATTRLGLAIGLEAMRMVEEGVATPEDIDLGMNLGYQHAVGPLHMTDMVGLDVRLAIAEHMEQELGPRFAPPQILRDMVKAGKLGRKSGEGFFIWE
ncbi:3-hydroxyacyl-CoA dehydrogenase family protein [Leucobacter sp. USHLN153]|uniref:3-hydroxyacyl-CoA dehydrogenase family protein n=1 Tax=Leucobacter sp. USHLN153 TaxID=3081268 RepID=UPI00301A4E82